MKKSTTLVVAILMLVAIRLNAQNDRVLLFECFTSASCGPCAQYNPALDALINSNGDRIAAIKYHMNWPTDTDPMNHDNPTDNNSRKSYYNVNSVPYTFVDGNRYNGSPSGINQNLVNNWLTNDSPLDMRLKCEVDEAANIVTVYVMGRASTAITESTKLYVGVIEKAIHYSSAPSSNEEKDFYHVMKKLLPSASGTTLGNLEAGDFFAYTFTWEMANVYNVDEIDAIAWVQEPSSKGVIQACKSSENVVPFYELEAEVNDIAYMPSMSCSGEAEPSVTIRNYGSLPITSVNLEVLVNGEVSKTLEWDGNLNFLEKTVVDLGQITFEVQENNTFEVRIASVNGVSDAVASNNVASMTFKASPDNSGATMKLMFRTDKNPQQNTWKLTNLTTGEIVQEGGPYDQANHTYNVTFSITSEGCYDFTVYDAGGDGLVGNSIYIVSANSTSLFTGGSFTDRECNEFSYGNMVGVEETSETLTSVFPNPTSGVVNVVCDGEQAVVIYNLAGQRVYQGVAQGQLKIDLSGFGAGVYAIKVGDKVWRTVVK